jgi:hypothetical protein
MTLRSMTSIAALALVLGGCPNDPTGSPDAGSTADGGGVAQDVGVPVGDAGALDAGEAPVQITGVTPVSGTARGGTRVRLSGVGFLQATEVLVNGIPASDVLTLNERILTFRTPSSQPGEAIIRVSNSLGSAESSSFTYYDPLELSSIAPAFGSTLGGTAVTLVGDGFTDRTAVLIGGRAVRGMVVVSPTEITGFAPPAAAASEVDVEVVNAFGRKVLPLAFRYHSPVWINQVSPAGGTTAGNYVIILSGTGFAADSVVELGGEACHDTEVLSATTIRCVVPAAGQAGAVDVTVSGLQGSDTLSGGFVYVDANSNVVSLAAVVPSSGPSSGGNTVALIGTELDGDFLQVFVGEEAAGDVVVVGDTLEVTVPAGAVGSHDVRLTTGNGGAELADAYTYYTALSIGSVSPNRGPVDGGTEVSVSGAGFGEALEAWLGGVPLEITRTGDSFTFVTPASSGGPAELRLRLGRQVVRLADAFVYEAPLSLVGIHPNRGAQAGGTYVVVTGSGFSKGPMRVLFGFNEGTRLQVLNDNTAVVYTPSQVPGLYDVTVAIDAENVAIDDGFTFFDPGFALGGVHGGDIEGALNVTVLTPTMVGLVPVANALVFLGLEADTEYATFTNAAGQATLSGPEVYGPQTVTAVATGCSATSVAEASSSDVTLIVSCPGGGGGGGGGGASPPYVLPRIQGCVTNFSKALFDTGTLGPDERAFAQVDLTRKNVFGQPTQKFTVWEIPVPVGGQPCQTMQGNCRVIQGTDMVFEDGGCFDFATVPGRYALLAWAGVYNIRTQEVVELRQLGVRRSVQAVLGETLAAQNIQLSYPLDASLSITLQNAPGQLPNKPGPNRNKVTTFLNFGGEGGYPLGDIDGVSPVLTQNDLPDFPGEFLTFYGGAFTRSWDPAMVTGPQCSNASACAAGQTCANTQWGQLCSGGWSFSYPYSVGVRHGVGDLEAGVTLDPILPFPELESPVNGGVLRNGYFRWKPAETGPTPSLYKVIMINLGTQQRWEFFVPGNQRKFRLPNFPQLDDENMPPVPGAGAYIWALSAIYSPGFDYDAWAYTDLNTIGRRAWTFDVEYFTKNF